MKSKSASEEALAFMLKCEGLKGFKREYKILADRKFLSDFAWPSAKLIVEVEGGTFVQGRHSRGVGFEKDCEKYNLATLAGWRVLRFPTNVINREPGAVLDMIRQALNG